MKKVIIILASVLALGCVFLFLHESRRQLPDSFRSVALNSISTASDINLEAGDFTEGYSQAKVTKSVKASFEVRRALVADFQQRPLGWGQPVALCHFPRHCVRCTGHEGGVTTILVCFECDTISFADIRNYHPMPQVYTGNLKRIFEEAGFTIDATRNKKDG